MSDKIISVHDNDSLLDLGWKPEQPVLLYEHNPKTPDLAVLMRPYGLMPLHCQEEINPTHYKHLGVITTFRPRTNNAQTEQYIFLINDTILGLWPPEPDKDPQTLYAQRIGTEASQQPYNLTHAITGRRAITNALYDIGENKAPSADARRPVNDCARSIGEVIQQVLNEPEMRTRKKRFYLAS